MAKPFVAETRLYLNADKSAVVAEDSPEATYLLAPVGGYVAPEEVKRYGLKDSGSADAAPAADPPPADVLTEAGSFQPAGDQAPEGKAVAPAEDKAVAGPEKKGA